MGSIEAWAEQYVLSAELSMKLSPPPLPQHFAQTFEPKRLERPGRPPELQEARHGERIPKPEALREKIHRARALHTFLHHELQAAELMCWAVLAFSDAEEEFRRGLLRVCFDEIRHMNMYKAHIEALGSRIGDFKVRDWFWTRVPSCANKISFAAVMGMGLEAANLEYAPTFAERFRAVGDERGAVIQEQIAEDEIAHVRFASHWFQRWTGGLDFDEWVSRLPAPWSPMVLHGDPIAFEMRKRGGMSDEFLARLASYVPDVKGRQ